MITKNDWISYLKTLQNEPEDQKILKMLQYGSQNYDQLSSEVKTVVDNTFELLTQKLGGIINALPDSKKKRQYQRLYARATGEHLDVKYLLNQFNIPPVLNLPILVKTKEIFTSRMQNATDFLFDITKRSQKGPAEFAILTLTSLCINELLCAFHLIEHSYITQAYSHIRTAHEMLDKIKLFHEQPKWATVWSSEDDKPILKELSPSAVRKKMGNPKFDPIYAFFSSMGPHGTFRSVQTTCAKSVKLSPKGKPLFKIWVGGTRFEHHFVWASTFLIHVLMQLLSRLIDVYEKDLHPEEMLELLDLMSKEYKDFMQKYLVTWAKKEKMDTAEIESYLDKFKTNYLSDFGGQSPLTR